MAIVLGESAVAGLFIGNAEVVGIFLGEDLVPDIGQAIGRIAEITTMVGGRAAFVPQAWTDSIALEYNSMLAWHAEMHTHPHKHTVKAGRFSDPTVWQGGAIPGEGESFMVVHNIIFDVESNVKYKDVMIGSKVSWTVDPTLDTRLWVDTFMCMGTYIVGTESDPIPVSPTTGKPRHEMIFHPTEAPGASERLGLMTMGPVRIHGARKATHLQSATNINAGATSAILPMQDANWRVGDKILFVATTNGGTTNTDAQYTGPTQYYYPGPGTPAVKTRNIGYHLSHDEVRTITAISGDNVTWDTALTYNHVVTTDTLPHGETVTVNPVVAMLTHSIRYRSATSADGAGYDITDLQKRGHIMFMHHDDVDVRYAEALNLARTSTDPSLVIVGGSPVRDTNGGTIITNDNNVRGRYAWHIHRTGPFFARKQVIFKGLSAWAPSNAVPIPGWAITHHSSRAAIEDCVVYNVRGAGIVSELGNEIGQWVNNVVSWCRGDGFGLMWGERAEQWQNHNGHSGVAYENQARQVVNQGNIASSSHIGWAYLQQNTGMLARVPDKYSLRLYDGIVQGGLEGITADTQGISGYGDDNDTYGIEQAQIPDFNHNISFGCTKLLFISHRQYTDRHDTSPMIARGNHAIKTITAVDIANYSFHYSFYDALWVGINGVNDALCAIGDNTFQINFANIKLRDSGIGFSDFSNGHGGLNYNGFFIDCESVNVTTPFKSTPVAYSTSTEPEDLQFYGAMGPWTITDRNTPNPGFTAIIRTWANTSSASLPSNLPAAPLGAGGVEPLPGTPKPYFYLDPGSDTTLTPTGFNTISLSGVLVDHVGVRKWPEGYTSAVQSAPVVLGPHKNYYTPGTEIVRRNGCFNDAGTWKTRLYVVEHDRLDGAYFVFSIDLTLSGFDSDFLAANTIVSKPPQLPLPMEKTLARSLVADTTAPAIVSSPTGTIDGGRVLAIPLYANDASVVWTITGGADSTSFEIATVANRPTLRWASNGTKDYNAPTDADANNTYVVVVTATDPFGNASSQSITVTVESALPPYSENLVFGVNYNRDSFEDTAGTIPASSSVRRWDDMVGSNDLTSTNAATLLASGIQFTNTNQVMTRSADLGLTSFTVVSQVRVATNVGFGNYVISQGSDGASWGLRMNGSGSNLRPGFKVGANNGGFSAPDLSLDTEYVIAGSFDNTSKARKGYVDGVERLSDTLTGVTIAANATLNVGHNAGSMTIKREYVYNRVLSAAEIAAVRAWMLAKA